MPHMVDLAFAAIVFVSGAPVDYFVIWPYMQRKLTSGEAAARTHVYWLIMAEVWLPTVFVAVRWWMLGRPWSSLWLILPHGWRLIAGVLGVLAVVPFWRLQNRALARITAEKRAALRTRWAHMIPLAPHTAGEHRWWCFGVSITAGICEELLYRGFLVWLLKRWLGLWWAALVSIIAFGALHAYQGKDVVRPAVVGALLQGFALLTGSILPGIVVHALLDMATSGYMLVREPAVVGQSVALSEL